MRRSREAALPATVLIVKLNLAFVATAVLMGFAAFVACTTPDPEGEPSSPDASTPATGDDGGEPGDSGEAATANDADATSATCDGDAKCLVSSAGDLRVGRSGHTQTTLANGRVLVIGGYNLAGGLASTEIFDPITGTWHLGPASVVTREAHRVVPLAAGGALVAGGYVPAGLVTASVELFDEATETLTPTAPMTAARRAFAMVRLKDGRVLAMGGGAAGMATCTKSPCSLESAELFDPVTKTWTLTGSMGFKRSSFFATVLADGKVLVGGGVGRPAPDGPDSGAGGSLGTTEIYDPATGVFTPGPPTVEATAASFETAVTLASGKVLLVRANEPRDGGTSNCEIYDPSTSSWSLTGKMLPGTRRGYVLVVLADGRVLVAGGSDAADPATGRKTVEVFDPSTETWTSAADLKTARMSAEGSRLLSGQVLISGGWENQNPAIDMLQSSELLPVAP